MSLSANNSKKTPPKTEPVAVKTKVVPLETGGVKKIYVHIKDPDDHASLMSLKQTCSDYVGLFDIILVLGADKKSAVKLPFKVDASNDLVGALAKILGEDSVVFK